MDKRQTHLPPMPKTVFDSERSICQYFELTTTELKQACTHHSAKLKNNGSRWAFVGMYTFKGLVAQWIHNHVGGTGTQLQHFLGNVTSNNYVATLFDKWQLSRFARYSPDVEVEKIQHIFVFSLIGCIVQNSPPQKVEGLIMDYFIAPNDHLLPQIHYPKDDWQKFIILCAQHGIDRPTLQYTALPDGKHSFTVQLNGFANTQEQSVSYRYAKKKTIKKAFLRLLDFTHQQLLSDPNYQQIEEKRKQDTEKRKRAEQEEKIAQWNEKKEKKKQLNEQKQEERKRLKALEDAKRKALKKEQKTKTSRKGQNTIYRDYTPEEIAAMNPAKRRRLEDLGILAKRK